MTGHVRLVSNVCAYFSLMIGREAHPVIDDRTRPVIQGAYLTLIGPWHCRVRSFLQRVRSLCCCALLRHDQRVRSFTGPARPVGAMSASGRCFVVSHWATGTSGQLDQRVRSVLRDLAVVRPARPVNWTNASGQYDFSCLSF
jgi:hypothetical protein